MVDLFVTSFKATSEYSKNHIFNLTDKIYYEKACKEILYASSYLNTLDDIWLFSFLKYVNSDVIKKRYYLGRPRKSYELGCTHSILIIASLKERFL